jgi:serine/threonine protein kinase
LRFFTMEYIQGQSLRSLLNERKKINGPPFSFSEVMAIMTPLLDALSYAHQYTVHRDIKPENIMVLGEFPDIAIKVLDFGIAKTLSPSRFSQKAQALGTAYYMAPEQMAGGADVDHRADLYSVGMVFYEMLMGQVAVGIPDLPTRIYPELPEDIDGVIIRILKPFAKDRYGSADEVKKALQEIASLPVTADKETPSAAAQRGEKGKDKSKEKPASGPKKSRALPIVLGLICLLVVGGLVYWWLPGKKGPGLPEIVSQTAVLQKESSPKMEAPEVPSNSLAKGRAMLQVTSVAEGATVFLAGRRLGQTPYTGEGLSEGELPLRLEHKYYSVREEKIVLSADQVTKCN